MYINVIIPFCDTDNNHYCLNKLYNYYLLYLEFLESHKTYLQEFTLHQAY